MSDLLKLLQAINQGAIPACEELNEPTPTQGYGVYMGNNLMIDSRVGELISLRD